MKSKWKKKKVCVYKAYGHEIKTNQKKWLLKHMNTKSRWRKEGGYKFLNHVNMQRGQLDHKDMVGGVQNQSNKITNFSIWARCEMIKKVWQPPNIVLQSSLAHQTINI
jgi:hypothetical protein